MREWCAVRVKVVRDSDGNEYGRRFNCPGCSDFARKAGMPEADIEFYTRHVIPTVGEKAWGYNGSLELPTFTPSILVHAYKREDGSVHQPQCHSFVTDGKIHYLGDCGHALAGQSVDLPEVE
jgi:hypothetical protein